MHKKNQMFNILTDFKKALHYYLSARCMFGPTG
jgi:hypothetical protein